MTVINVAPSVYYDAATICSQAATSFFGEVTTQFAVLARDTATMAGSIGAGKDWAGSYDQQTTDTYLLVKSLVGAIDNYCDLLIEAGYNHALADHDPKTGTPSPERPSTPQAALTVCPALPASAGGPGSGLVDDGLDLAAQIGVPIPDGDTGKLTAAVTAWHTLATGQATANLPVELERAAVLFQAVTAPDTDFIDEDLRELKTAADDLLTTFADLATACRDQKSALDELRTQLRDVLEQLATEIATEIAVTLALSVAASVISFGVGSAAVTALRAGKMADKVTDYVTRLRTLIHAAKLKTTVTLQKSIPGTRGKLQRIIDLTKKHGDGVTTQTRQLLKQKLDNAQVWSGRNLPTTGGPPNGYLIKRDPQGNITRYSYYDENGVAVSRVDLTGKPHYDKESGIYIPTPHVVEIVRNTNPKTGQVFADTDPSTTRPALPEEIPL